MIKQNLVEYVDAGLLECMDILLILYSDPLEHFQQRYFLLVFCFEDFLQHRLEIFGIDECDVQSVEKFLRINENFHHLLMVAFHDPDRIEDDILGEIGAEQPKQLIVVQTIPDVGLGLEDLAKIVEKALPIYNGLAEGRVGLEDHVLAFVALA